MNGIDLSIVIVSYNTKDLLYDCLKSIYRFGGGVNFEVIVSDNNSNDGSCEMVKRLFPKIKLFENKQNLGFAKANNQARSVCQGEYVLFLNSDTILGKDALSKTINHLKLNTAVGALTCKLILPSGKLDRDTRRSFPTPWVALTHLVLKLDRLFPTSKLFARYWYGFLSPDKESEVDVIQGAFFLTRKQLLDKIDWFDEDYFLDGEDVDLCWKIKAEGFKIIYYPEVSVIHIKGASKDKDNNRRLPLRDKIYFRNEGVRSMEIFYRKRFWHQYPILLNYLVLSGIQIVKVMRVIKTLLLG